MSKAFIEVLSTPRSESFLVRRFGREAFEAPLHFHPEYEITCILKGSGTRFVGADMNFFEKDDLVLIGASLPHCWKLDDDYNEPASSVVIQFTKHFLGETFFDVPEVQGIRALLHKSASGIRFTGKKVQKVRDKMLHLSQLSNRFESLLALLELLQELSTIRHQTILNNKQALQIRRSNDSEKVNTVFAFIIDQFQDRVNLEEAAATIGMTPNAFCKYFKKITRKTFMETVTDYRISHAAQLLTETEKSISDICYESGFRDLSHFYKTFVSRQRVSPLNYRKQYRTI